MDGNDNKNCDEEVSPDQLEHFCTNDILPALMDQNKRLSITLQTDKRNNRETDRQTDKDRPAEKPTDRQTDRHILRN